MVFGHFFCVCVELHVGYEFNLIRDKKMDKKQENRFSFVIDKSIITNFKNICIKQDTTASQEIRKFIKEYIKKNRQSTMDL